MLCCASTGSRRLLLVASVVAAGAGFVVGSAVPDAEAVAQRSQDDHAHGQGDHDMGGMPPEMMEAMMRWQEHASVGTQHKEMQSMAGTWLVESKFWMAPGTEAETNMMIANSRSVMGGRFMIEEMSGLMEMGAGPAPWSGMAISGYDNTKEKYFFVWFDSASTSLTKGYGDKTGRNEWTYEYEMYDAMTGMTSDRKNIITKKSDNESVFVMKTKGPDGKWFKNMEMTYTRSQ